MGKERNDEMVFIKTDNVEKIIRDVNRTIRKNGWLAVTGDVGTGKTTLINYLMSEWRQRPDQFNVIYSMGWRWKGSRANHIMKRMIRFIDPDEHVPGDVEFRSERLKTVLMRSHRAGKRTILIIDEGQDMTEPTMLELKKIHELSAFGEDHLFSIVMFGKVNSRLSETLKRRELGFRVSQSYLAGLGQKEILAFAEEKFELKFPKTKNDYQTVTDYFFQMVHPSPLGVKHFAEKLFNLSDFDGNVTVQHIRSTARQDVKARLKTYNVSYSQIAKEAGVSKSTVSEVYAGQETKYTDEVVRQVQKATEKCITQAQERQAI